MGVMLSLDRDRPSKGRRRQGQHVRHRRHDKQAQPLAAARRYYAPASGRLARLARAMVTRAVLTQQNQQVAGTRAAAGTAQSRSRQDKPDESVRGGPAPAA